MVGYHAAFDAVLFGAELPWLFGTVGTLWQLSICCTFVAVSGYCAGLSRRPLRHAVTLLLCGFLVTLVTTLFLPEVQIRCGVLTCLGLCGLVAAVLQRLPNRKPSLLIAEIFFLLFLVFYHLPDGCLGVGKFTVTLPSALYRTKLGYLVGLPSPWFFSGDYFPLLPWLFLYLAFFFLCDREKAKPTLAKIHFPSPAKPILFLGRHSLWVYLLHQPVIFLAFSLLT